ncbi:hypothetical protein F2P81_024934 [Scophthalmus maximus]|uniref:Uncharacterized protein n=1 Tax=Scophthalmus maximus TaxID=52904 RepID=A0A6A4RM73_SCOMX|nr:hypothetical protein F2P81_024934 [Scophthalmus maximus]
MELFYAPENHNGYNAADLFYPKKKKELVVQLLKLRQEIQLPPELTAKHLTDCLEEQERNSQREQREALDTEECLPLHLTIQQLRAPRIFGLADEATGSLIRNHRMGDQIVPDALQGSLELSPLHSLPAAQCDGSLTQTKRF